MGERVRCPGGWHVGGRVGGWVGVGIEWGLGWNPRVGRWPEEALDGYWAAAAHGADPTQPNSLIFLLTQGVAEWSDSDVDARCAAS